MQIDLRDAELPAESLRAQVCILGGGIAGLVLAHRLAREGIEVLLLEAGGLGLEPQAQPDASQVEMLGHPHAGSSEGRTWAWGGSSLTWGGQLLPLPNTCPAKPGLLAASAEIPPHPAWPIAPRELSRFQAEAEQLLGVNDLPYDASAFFEAAHAPLPALLQELPSLTPRLSKFIPFAHRNLAQALGRDLLPHPRVRVLFHATATGMLPGKDDPSRIDEVTVRIPSGGRVSVHAEHFVLAAGTVETVRLLLSSRAQSPAGLGNRHDQVGRNVHDHLTWTAATFTGTARERVLRDLRPSIFPGPRGSVAHSVKFEGAVQAGPSRQSVPVMAHFVIEEPDDSAVHNVRTLLHARQSHPEPARALRALLPQLPSALAGAARLAWEAKRLHRRYVSPEATVSLRLNAAQPTPSASRIALSRRKDEIGRALPALDWVITAEECEALASFAQGLLACLRSALNPEEIHCSFDGQDLLPHITDARHLMGGAVMGADPRTSVVDPNLRLHGIRNLHIASLAVFPDGRAQLPTLTLVALTLRLAERLRQMLG